MDVIGVCDKYIKLFSTGPNWLIIIVSSLIVGYVLRKIRTFPNGGIPLTVILWGAVFNCLLSPEEPNGIGHRIWIGKNILFGLVWGFLAWMIHKKGLRYLEYKYPWLISKDTTFFSRSKSKKKHRK